MMREIKNKFKFYEWNPNKNQTIKRKGINQKLKQNKRTT
jgi:hypothetical protein